MQQSAAVGVAIASATRHAPIVRSQAGRRRQPKDAALLNALTIIVHDLRGPLANLGVLVELMAAYSQMQSHERVAASARKAEEMIKALDSMLNGFLQRVRETGDPLSFKPGLVDLSDVVTAAIDLNRPLAESRSIGVTAVAGPPSIVSGDRRLLIEAVDNLVGNAVKYSPTGSSVTCTIVRSDGDVVIQIADGGQGLSAADLKKAFRPFATLSASYSSKTSSWGLGLWIVRLIAERHGGFVDVRSRSDEPGACIELHLPADRL